MRCVVFLGASSLAVAQAPGLKIVVIAGEDAVNIIQQKSAVAPIIEVRDRNDQPVAGALVNFSIRGGRATFGGARALTVTTDLAGRAVATGLTPTTSGALQISASAAFQGQTAAVVTITQTNVMTAAQAAAVSSAAGSSGGSATGAGSASGGAAGGGGGGLSLTTIGLIGGAVAGGAVVATQVIGGQGGTIFIGTFTGGMAEVFSNCTRNHAANGQVKIEVDDASASSLSGSGTINGTFVGNGSSCVNDQFATRTQPFDNTVGISGPGSFTFNGALAGAEITGTVRFDATTTLNGVVIAVTLETYPVTLRMQ